MFDHQTGGLRRVVVKLRLTLDRLDTDIAKGHVREKFRGPSGFARALSVSCTDGKLDLR